MPGAEAPGPWEAMWSISQRRPTGVFVTNCWASVIEGHSGMLILGAATENAPGQRESGTLVPSLSRVRLFVTPWTVACQTPLSMGILQARILDELPCPPPRDLPNTGIKPRSPALQVDSLPSEPPGLEQAILQLY